jgi:hypothetical protein
MGPKKIGVQFIFEGSKKMGVQFYIWGGGPILFILGILKKIGPFFGESKKIGVQFLYLGSKKLGVQFNFEVKKIGSNFGAGPIFLFWGSKTIGVSFFIFGG